MVRGATIGFVVSMLLTTVVTWLMLTGTIHAQRSPQHVFSGLVQNFGEPVWQGRVSFLDMSGQEVATGDISGGRYKIGVVEPVGRNYSGQGFHIAVTFQNRIYEWQKRMDWQAGGVTVLDLDVEGWKWHAASSPDRQQEDQRRMDQIDEDRARMLAEDQRRMDQNDEDRARRMKMEEDMRREQMEMERERMEREQMERGQPGVQPVPGERPKSGPGRGLFSNSKAGEATSGIDNIMDPGMLTIIGIALTVLTTGMTLFKGD